jgi:hypothetical protein
MFRLSESDYRKLSPLAVKVYKRSARSAHVAQLMESKVGRRALVDMMFLESGIDDIGSTFEGLTIEDQKEIAEKQTLDAMSDMANMGIVYDNFTGKDATFVKNSQDAQKMANIQILGKASDNPKNLFVSTMATSGIPSNEFSKYMKREDFIKTLSKITTQKKKEIEQLRQKIGSSNAQAQARLDKIEKNLEDLTQIVSKWDLNDPKNIDAIIKAIEAQKQEAKKIAAENEKESKGFFNSIKNFFIGIGKWIGKTALWQKIAKIFVNEAEGKSVRWGRIAIVAIALVAIGFLLFGTSIGQKIKNFVVNAFKAGINGVRSAVRYVLGKANAPTSVMHDAEEFLDEAAA